MLTGPTFSPPTDRPSARQRLLDTARTLFYRQGVNNVGIDLILQESGVAKATLYKHFASKDELILEFMRQGDVRWLSWLREATEAREPDPAKRLLAVFDTLAEWFALPQFRGCLLTNVTTELADPHHGAHALLRAHKERVRAYLEELAGAAGARTPASLSAALLLLLEGATAQARMARDPGAAHTAQAAARVLLDANRRA